MIEKTFDNVYFAEVDALEPTKAIQILKVGNFEHPKSGKLTITTKDLERFVESFSKNVRKIDLPINYEHLMSSAHGTKAAGWIKELRIENDGKELWAVPEWTPEGLREVKDKEYRYLSAELLFSYRDNETGVVHDRVLKGAALTNYPVIKGMAPIEASELSNNQKNEGVKKMNLTELKVHLSENGIDLAELERKSKAFDEASVKLSEATKELETVKQENVRLSSIAQEAEKKMSEIKFSELVSKGMTEGRLTKVLAEGSFKKIFEKNGAEFAEQFLSEMPVVVDVKPQVGHPCDVVDNSEASDVQKKVSELATAIMEKEKVNFSEACHRVFKDNSTLAQKWFALAE